MTFFLAIIYDLGGRLREAARMEINRKESRIVTVTYRLVVRPGTEFLLQKL